MQILNGNNLDLLKTLADNSVDSIVTDPPYGLSFMNKKWDYDVPSVELWKEVYRVLKHGGHVLSFGGTRTYHRMVVNMEDAGFEIRDQIMWLYGSGFPKSLNIGKAVDKIEGNEREVVKLSNNGSGVSNIKLNNHEKGDTGIGYMDGSGKNFILTKGQSAWEGWGTALKPANEPICLARKPLSEKSIAENVLKHGTGGINIDGCRVELHDGDDERLAGKGSWKTDKSGKNVYNGGYIGDEIKSSSLGRFPANVIHDGSEEVLQGFPDNTSRFFYCAKASKSDRNDGLDGFDKKPSKKFDGGNFDSASTNANERMDLNFHPTVKPTELMRYLCRLITPPNGIVLDPFMGSGSTGKGAILEGFDFIGMELDPEYVEIAKARIEHAQKEHSENQSQQKLF
jgi:site-specific DNA-methyltransferase (adenine-specific)